jgi:hypothetical protein
VINDKNRDWTDGPKHHESYTQQHCDSRAYHLDAQNAHEINFFHTDSHWLAFYPME